MTNPDPHPLEVPIHAAPCAGHSELLNPRDVPLGGLRAMTVRRTLPQRSRSLIGAWCFADHYGPDDISRTGGMQVAPHPHTGLATVSWLFEGRIEHRDSAGHVQAVLPGELNLMNAGRGISHSEISDASGPATLHGAQLWLALPDRYRFSDPELLHFVPPVSESDGVRLRVFLGALAGQSSPVPTYSPVLGAQLDFAPGARVEIDLEPDFEYGVLVDSGHLTAAGEPVAPAQLRYFPPGAARLSLVAGDAPARALLLGGEPLGESLIMWWNFVGRDHDEIVAFREEWQRQITRDGALITDTQDSAPGQFGIAKGDHLPPIPAPPMPGTRLKPRG